MVEVIVDRAGLRVQRAVPAAHLLLHCEPGDAAAIAAAAGLELPGAMLTSAIAGDWDALHLAPDEWLLIGPVADAAMLSLRFAEVAVPHSLVDIGDRSLGLEIEGAQAAQLLSAVCPLDIERLPLRGCTRTLFGKVTIMLWRRGGHAYTIEYTRSFDDYVTRLATLAAQDVD